MTPRVPLVCTPEELGELLFWSGEVAIELYRLRIGGDNHDAANHAKVRRDAALAALFRPAEERKEAERNTGFDSRSGATLPSSSGAGMANPVAGGRAPSQDALSSAPAAPPPAGEPAKKWPPERPEPVSLVVSPTCSEERDPWGNAESRVRTLAHAANNEPGADVTIHLFRAAHHASLAALRAENERLRRELEAKT